MVEQLLANSLLILGMIIGSVITVGLLGMCMLIVQEVTFRFIMWKYRKYYTGPEVNEVITRNIKTKRQIEKDDKK